MDVDTAKHYNIWGGTNSKKDEYAAFVLNKPKTGGCQKRYLWSQVSIDWR